MRPNRWLPLVLCLSALTLSAQTLPIDVEIGYRFTDVSGNENTYRTQINEDEGLLIRALTIAAPDFRLDVDDLGIGPASALRLEARRDNVYRLNVRYRRTDAFNALENFALGQHTFERVRDVVDADLELLRWSAVKPFVGYSWNRFEGPGTTTWHIGQDEFLLSQDLNDTERELRVGAGFAFGPVQGSITQGWRNFRGRESLTLAPGANNGNNPNPVLGRPVNVSELTRDEQTDVDTPFTTLYVTGQATSRIRLVGNFSRFAAETESESVDDAMAAMFAGGASPSTSKSPRTRTLSASRWCIKSRSSPRTSPSLRTSTSAAKR